MRTTLVNMMLSMEDKLISIKNSPNTKTFLSMHILKKVGAFSLIALFLYLSLLMLLITLQYIPLDLDAAFLATKQHVIKYQYYQIAFFAHVYSSLFILLLGSLQFIENIRNTYPFIHRSFGITYVFGIICISAPAGFVMGLHGNGGFIAQTSFCILSILWFYYTVRSFLAIKKGHITEHKNYMILSYALTLSALTLRLHKYILAHTVEMHRLDIYRLVSWSGWVINLGIAYAIIYRKKISKLNEHFMI